MGIPARCPLWEWSDPARGLLIVLATLIACGLLRASVWTRGEAPRLPPLVVDPNTAPRGVLGALPKIGPVLATRIVAARTEAPFCSCDELDTRVHGIGPATARALRPYLRIDRDPATTVPHAQLAFDPRLRRDAP
jgi:competence protein ComEA